jgi:hypothetical protein
MIPRIGKILANIIPAKPASADRPIASGTIGIVSKFAGIATKERFPVSYRRSGRTAICAAMVVAMVLVQKLLVEISF